MSYSAKFFRYQFRRLYTEYPEHFFAGLATALVVVFILPPKYAYHLNHPNIAVKAYKDHYTVYRSDDPRSYRIRCSPDLPPGDSHILKI